RCRRPWPLSDLMPWANRIGWSPPASTFTSVSPTVTGRRRSPTPLVGSVSTERARSLTSLTVSTRSSARGLTPQRRLVPIDRVASMSTELLVDDAWADVVGQERAVALLRNAVGSRTVHAWLFAGPRGSGKRAAARAFAGDVLALEADRAGRREDAERARRLARSEQHPDLIVVEREGAAISAEQADEIIRRASRSAT